MSDAEVTSGPHPAPKNEAETVYLYHIDPTSKLPVIIGKVFIDPNEDAWVRINSTALAAAIGVEDIDGVAMLNEEQFNNLEVA